MSYFLKNNEKEKFKLLKKIFFKFSNESNVALDYVNNLEKIEQAYNLLSDDDSRSCFLSELMYYVIMDLGNRDLAHEITSHRTKISELQVQDEAKESCFFDLFNCSKNEQIISKQDLLKSIADVFVKEQYCYKTKDILIRPDSNDICIDAGGYIGDTAIWMAKVCNVQKVYSFEFSQNNLIEFQKNIGNLEQHIAEKIVIVEKALSNNTGYSYIKIDNSSNINSCDDIILNFEKYTQKYGTDKLVKINSVSIDDFCLKNNIKVSFIKMDIEGAELLAIEGAKKIISLNKPTLAISAYHFPNDSYKLITQIHSYNSQYKFYLRRYARDNETVLFAK